MKGDHTFRGKPEGSTVGSYARARNQIGFDQKMRDEIAEQARMNNRSFGAEVRALVSQGLAMRKPPR